MSTFLKRNSVDPNPDHRSIPDACMFYCGSVPTRRRQRKHQPIGSLSISLQAIETLCCLDSPTKSPKFAGVIDEIIPTRKQLCKPTDTPSPTNHTKIEINALKKHGHINSTYGKN